MARHCGYCGSRGHNRRTCDSLTDAHRRQLAEYQRRLDDGSYVAGSVDESRLIGRITQTAATLAKRTGTNPLTGEAAVKPTRRQRKCSYCQSFEHDRRRCDALAKDKLIWQEATRIARADIVRRVQELGVGIGTLYVVRTGYYASDKSWQYGPRPLIVMAAHENYHFGSDYFSFIATSPSKIMEPLRNWSSTITLSTLENLASRSKADEEMGHHNDATRGFSPTTPFAFSASWLAAEEMPWAEIDCFRPGKRRAYALASLEHERTRRYHSNKVLVTAARNLGYIPQEEAATS